MNFELMKSHTTICLLKTLNSKPETLNFRSPVKFDCLFQIRVQT